MCSAMAIFQAAANADRFFQVCYLTGFELRQLAVGKLPISILRVIVDTLQKAVRNAD
jgi:hypothetical protein